jgi:DNA-binding response OmpR family regulator
MRILVVEDDARYADLLRRALAAEGYATDHARDGAEALDLLRAAPYDLVILDVMLPRLSGVELCRRLRELRQEVPVLLLTARDSIDDKVEGLDAGADDYLTKPAAIPELLARMRVLLRRHEGRHDPVLRAGPLVLDPRRHRLEIAERRVDLTSKEFAILEILMGQPERVFSRDEIAERVWGFDYAGESNMIDVYVGRLRKKLGDASGSLVTLRGRGYTLRP